MTYSIIQRITWKSGRTTYGRCVSSGSESQVHLPEISSIQVTPANPKLTEEHTAGDGDRKVGDETTLDITSRVAWSSSEDGIARVSRDAS